MFNPFLRKKPKQSRATRKHRASAIAGIDAASGRMFEAVKVTHELLTAEEYLRRYKANPASVSGAKIISAPFGASSFGYFYVPLDKPVYETNINDG